MFFFYKKVGSRKIRQSVRVFLNQNIPMLINYLLSNICAYCESRDTINAPLNDGLEEKMEKTHLHLHACESDMRFKMNSKI